MDLTVEHSHHDVIELGKSLNLFTQWQHLSPAPIGSLRDQYTEDLSE